MTLEVLCPTAGKKGLSPFVGEAGLMVGQNVHKDSPTPEVKLAFTPDEGDLDVAETFATYPPSYSYERGVA